MDSLFAVPFCAGLAVAGLLPLVGNLLRLRDEWLATLGLAHLAAASALVGMAWGVPPIYGAPAGAALGGALKHGAGGRGHSAYGLMILAGWSTGLLVAANTTLGDALAHAMVDGQLYFAGWRELAIDALILAAALPLLRRWTPRLIAARLFPEGERVNRLPAWRWHLGFDLLAALTVAAATATVGLMGAFALIFVPSWIAFRHASGWRHTNLLAVAIGVGGYVLAFTLALWLDQPFGPVLAAVLVVACGALAVRHRPAKAEFFGGAGGGGAVRAAESRPRPLPRKQGGKVGTPRVLPAGRAGGAVEHRHTSADFCRARRVVVVKSLSLTVPRAPTFRVGRAG